MITENIYEYNIFTQFKCIWKYIRLYLWCPSNIPRLLINENIVLDLFKIVTILLLELEANTFLQ